MQLTIGQYGVCLRRLTRDDLEEVRIHRNDPAIANRMIFRQTITPEMQEAWFEKVDNPNNFYFVVWEKERRVGLINLKDVNRANGTAEGGIFFWDAEFQASGKVTCATAVNMQFGFEVLGLRLIKGRILHDNRRAIRLTTVFGGRLVNSQTLPSSELLDFYETTREDFLRALEHYKPALEELAKG